DRSHCGPRIQIFYELLRWWDRWLKGIDNGVEQEPQVIVYVQEFEEPIQDRTHIAGGWYAAGDLPADVLSTWHLGAAGALWATPPLPVEDSGVDQFSYLPGASPDGGLWDGGSAYCLPGDQRRDEAFGLNHTSEPLAEEMVVFGRPAVEITVAADAPVMPLAVRLCEVGEDGTSVLVTKGILNLTRRHGMDRPEPLTPGEAVPINMELEATAWRFRKGHRMRLSINGSDFPNVRPTPCRGPVAIHGGPGAQAALRLPLWREPAPSPVEFLPSESAVAPTGSGGDPPPWRVVQDVLEDRLRFLMASGNEFAVSNRDPAFACTRAKTVSTAAWDGFTARAEAHASLVSDEQAFHLTLTLNVTVNEAPHFQRQWHQSVARR